MRTKATLGQMVQEGRFRGGFAPYGYDLVPSGTYNKRKHEVFKLEINPDEAKVVRMMFDLFVGSGYGRFKIANFLSELVNNARTRMLDANAKLTELNEEVEKAISALKPSRRITDASWNGPRCSTEATWM